MVYAIRIEPGLSSCVSLSAQAKDANLTAVLPGPCQSSTCADNETSTNSTTTTPYQLVHRGPYSCL